MDELAGTLGKLDNPEPDITVFRSVFYGVGEEIDQNLVDSGLIAHQIFVFYVRHGHIEALVFFICHRAYDRIHGGYQIV